MLEALYDVEIWPIYVQLHGYQHFQIAQAPLPIIERPILNHKRKF